MKILQFRTNYSVNLQAFVLETTLTISLKKLPWRLNLLNGSHLYYKTINCEKILPFVQLQGNPAVASSKEQLNEKMTSNPAFTEKKYIKGQCLSPRFSSGAKYLVTYHTLPSLYVCVWLVNTLTSITPIGSPIICMWYPANICEQWERNLSFGSADVSGTGTRDEPLRTSAWEAKFCMV